MTEPTDPAPTNPAPTDPAPTDPAPTDPAPTDPAPTDPAPTDPSPVEYKIPEGYPDSIKDMAKTEGFTNEQLNHVIEYFSNVSKEYQDAAQDQLNQQGQALVESWGEDKDQNISLIWAALDYHDESGDFKQWLKVSGFGNHPVMLQHLLSLGSKLKEGGFIRSEANTPTRQATLAKKLFPNNN